MYYDVKGIRIKQIKSMVQQELKLMNLVYHDSKTTKSFLTQSLEASLVNTLTQPSFVEAAMSPLGRTQTLQTEIAGK